MCPYMRVCVRACVQPFKKLTNYQYTMYCDPEREVYKALGLYERVAVGSLDSKCYVFSFLSF